MHLDGWNDFGVAVTGVSGALVGLLFVALSINLRQIVGSAELPGRAVFALVLLLVPMLAGMLLLVPQDVRAYGVELLLIGVVATVLLVRQARPGARPSEQPLVGRIVATFLPVLIVGAGTVGGGVLLARGHPGGAYGVAAASVAAFVGAVLTTWVLLVEIVR